MKGQKLKLERVELEQKQWCFDCFHFYSFFFLVFVFVVSVSERADLGQPANGWSLLLESEKRECAFINSDPDLPHRSYRTTVLVFVFFRVRIRKPAKIYSVLK